MIEFLLLPANIPFVISLAVMLVFTLLEVVSSSFGVGISEMVDSFLPEFDADIDIDSTVVGEGSDSLSRLLSWFRIGEVPVVMLFIVFLTGFGLIGLILQFVAASFVGGPLPRMLAVLLAFMASLPMVRICGGLLGRYLPKDETYVVSEESFIGMVVTFTLATARVGNPVEAKLRDRHGQTHYVMVEPDEADIEFQRGEKALIVSKNGSIYRVIPVVNSTLTENE